MMEEVEAPVDPQATFKQLRGRVARRENLICGRHVWVWSLTELKPITVTFW